MTVECVSVVVCVCVCFCCCCVLVFVREGARGRHSKRKRERESRRRRRRLARSRSLALFPARRPPPFLLRVRFVDFPANGRPFLPPGTANGPIRGLVRPHSRSRRASKGNRSGGRKREPTGLSLSLCSPLFSPLSLSPLLPPSLSRLPPKIQATSLSSIRPNARTRAPPHPRPQQRPSSAQQSAPISSRVLAPPRKKRSRCSPRSLPSPPRPRAAGTWPLPPSRRDRAAQGRRHLSRTRARGPHERAPWAPTPVLSSSSSSTQKGGRRWQHPPLPLSPATRSRPPPAPLPRKPASAHRSAVVVRASAEQSRRAVSFPRDPP